MFVLRKTNRLRLLQKATVLQNLCDAQPQRCAQHLQLQVSSPDGVESSFSLVNLHSPSSERHKLTQNMKNASSRTLLRRVPPPFIIGGDLNMVYIGMSLIASDLERAHKSQEKHHIVSSLEHGAFHGDLALVRGMRTEHEDTLIGHRFKLQPQMLMMWSS